MVVKVNAKDMVYHYLFLLIPPCLYFRFENKINFYNIDIRNYNSFNQIFNEIKPDFIFHLATQAIVSESYNDPLNTFH